MKKNRLSILLPVLLLALALTACGGSAQDDAAETAPDYLGTYNMIEITFGPLVVSPSEYGYEGAYIELKDDGNVIFNDGTQSEEVPCTVDGTEFSMSEGDTTLYGTLQNEALDLRLTNADLGGEGDDVAMVMHFAKAGSDAETALKDELASAGTTDEQMDAMSADDLAAFIEEYGFLLGK